MGAHRWLGVGFVACSLLIGVAAYSIGVSQGAADAAVAAGSSFEGWRWHSHWAGFPFGFFIMFWIVLAVLRSAFWGWGGPWSYRRRWRDDWYDDDPRRFAEWHRREHERMARFEG